MAPSTHAPASGPALSQATRILLGLAAAVVVLAGMSFARGIIGPLAVAIVIVIICAPVRRPLERWGLPSWLATTAVILVSYAVLIIMALLLAFAVAEFTELAIDYAPALRDTADLFIKQLDAIGMDAQASDAITGMLTPARILDLAASLGNTLLVALTALFFIFAYMIFMAADAARYAKAESSFGASAKPRMTRFAQFNGSVRRYFVVNAAFGLLVAVVDALALWAMGVPAPIVWGVLAFVTNFVPNIGFVLGLVPPAVLALVVGGWPLMIAVVAVYCVANVGLQVLIQPKFVSDAVNLSLTLSFVSVLFWTFIIGPLGAILAIPLTLLARALLLEGDPNAKWLRWLTGDTSVTERG